MQSPETGKNGKWNAIRYAHRLADFEPPTNSEKVAAVTNWRAHDHGDFVSHISGEEPAAIWDVLQNGAR